MGRLINTDDLIGCAIIKPMTSEEFGHILACENKLVHDDIPTAYDVEAVVKELEELKQIEMNDECPMDICGDCECSIHKCKGRYTSKAIDIVRRGGVK